MRHEAAGIDNWVDLRLAKSREQQEVDHDYQ
jgi:hypothetical protein